MKCEHCGDNLQALNPPVEDYLKHKFCFNIFGWKLMLIKDFIEYGCMGCLVDEQDSNIREAQQEAVYYAIQNEIEKGNLIPKR